MHLKKEGEDMDNLWLLTEERPKLSVVLAILSEYTEPLITHTYPLEKIDEAYELFENKRDGVIKVAVEC